MRLNLSDLLPLAPIRAGSRRATTRSGKTIDRILESNCPERSCEPPRNRTPGGNASSRIGHEETAAKRARRPETPWMPSSAEHVASTANVGEMIRNLRNRRFIVWMAIRSIFVARGTGRNRDMAHTARQRLNCNALSRKATTNHAQSKIYSIKRSP